MSLHRLKKVSVSLRQRQSLWVGQLVVGLQSNE